jgi:hypothetical protein
MVTGVLVAAAPEKICPAGTCAAPVRRGDRANCVLTVPKQTERGTVTCQRNRRCRCSVSCGNRHANQAGRRIVWRLQVNLRRSHYPKVSLIVVYRHAHASQRVLNRFGGNGLEVDRAGL